jgi:hypothetical protein
MNKKGKILFFCMIFVNLFAFSQESPSKRFSFLLAEVAKNTGLKPFTAAIGKNTNNCYLPYFSPSFYTSKLGFFCKQEIKFDKISKIPFRFRLGSVDQCDRLEGKIR